MNRFKINNGWVDFIIENDYHYRLNNVNTTNMPKSSTSIRLSCISKIVGYTTKLDGIDTVKVIELYIGSSPSSIHYYPVGEYDIYIEDIKRVSEFQLLITLIIAFTFDKKLLLISLIISLSLLTYHFMLSFFQKLIIIVKKENANEYSYKNHYEYNKNDNSYGQYNYKSKKNNDNNIESDKSNNFKQ